MQEVYTFAQIKEFWNLYQNTKAWRVLRDGKWKLYKKSPDTGDGATKVTMIHVKDHMEFPKFIEVFVNG